MVTSHEGSPTKQYFRSQAKPPVLAGAMIVLVAAFVVGLIALRADDSGPSLAITISTPVQAQAQEAQFVTVHAVATTNVRAQPERFAAVVAILPAKREASVLGRTPDGSWLRITYPPYPSTPGWVPAGSIRIDDRTLEALPTIEAVASSTSVSVASESDEAELPDLMIADVFLLQDGRLAVDIRNVGKAALVEMAVPLNVSKTSGDILGVLRIGPTTLAPGASATVVTTVVATETGNYLLEIDRSDEIRESSEFNNSYTALLIVDGS